MADADTTPTEGNEDQSTTDGTQQPTTGTEETTETAKAETDEATPSADELATKLRSKTQESSKYQKRAQKAESELAKFREAQKTEQEKAIEAARKEGMTEGRSLGDKRLIRAEVIAAAAGKAADPGDVYAILTGNGALSGIEVSEDGAVDTDAIRGLVDGLVKDKPHLAAVRTPGFGARAQAQAERPDMDMDAWIRGQAGR